MTIARTDIIGASCAAVAIGLIAWLSLDSWAVADCQDLLRYWDFQQAGETVSDPELLAVKARLAAGEGSPEEQACVARIGLPFK